MIATYTGCCGGSVINSKYTNYKYVHKNIEPLNIIRWVITAWHCVWAEVLEGIMPVWKVAVVVGAHNKSSCVKYDRENTKYIISTALAHVSN